MIPRVMNAVLPSDEKKRAAIFAGVSFLAGMMISPILSFTITGTLSSLQERATFPMLERRIEIVRTAIHQAPCDTRILAFAPLIHEAVQWNLRIAHEQEANRHLLTTLFSTDRWNALTLIPLPCEETP